MKRSRSSCEALSPLSSECPLPEQHCAAGPVSNVYTECFEDDQVSCGTLDPLQQYLDSCGNYQVQTNTSNQSELLSTDIDAQRSCLQARRVFESDQQSTAQQGSFLRGVTKHAEHPGSIPTHRETRSTQQDFPRTPTARPYNKHHRSYSITSQRPTVTSMPNPSAAGPEVRSSLYSPFRGLFFSSNQARDHRHMSTRFDREPYIHPHDDPSIAEVEDSRSYQVGRIYEAMTRGDRAQDNTNSIAMKRWVNVAHYKSDLVEAFAHKVFDCLLVQVKEGFRGWHHNDYVDDDRKGEKEDREADCMSRLENIIDALEREKTICEDVVTSASQIRMFVNAPIAYAARKYQNRVGNSKRGRTKESGDSNSRPSKVRRTGGRHTSARSTTASELPVSRDTTPQFQTMDQAALPYYLPSKSQHLAASPVTTYLTPRQPLQRSANSVPQVPTGYRQATAISSPGMNRSSSIMPRVAMSPPSTYSTPHPTSHTSPPCPAYSPNTATYSPNAAIHSLSSSPVFWSPDTPFDAIDPSLTLPGAGLAPHTWPSGTSAVDPADLASTCVSAPYPQNPTQSISQNPAQSPETNHNPIDAVTQEHKNNHAQGHAQEHAHETGSHTECVPEEGGFESYWNDLPGVQPFSFRGW